MTKFIKTKIKKLSMVTIKICIIFMKPFHLVRLVSRLTVFLNDCFWPVHLMRIISTQLYVVLFYSLMINGRRSICLISARLLRSSRDNTWFWYKKHLQHHITKQLSNPSTSENIHKSNKMNTIIMVSEYCIWNSKTI
jgi:hypothetical protein